MLLYLSIFFRGFVLYLSMFYLHLLLLLLHYNIKEKVYLLLRYIFPCPPQVYITLAFQTNEKLGFLLKKKHMLSSQFGAHCEVEDDHRNRWRFSSRCRSPNLYIVICLNANRGKWQYFLLGRTSLTLALGHWAVLYVEPCLI